MFPAKIPRHISDVVEGNGEKKVNENNYDNNKQISQCDRS